MTNNDAIRYLIEMFGECRVYGVDKPEYHEAIAHIALKLDFEKEDG